jgi:hypothetical protein
MIKKLFFYSFGLDIPIFDHTETMSGDIGALDRSDMDSAVDHKEVFRTIQKDSRILPKKNFLEGSVIFASLFFIELFPQQQQCCIGVSVIKQSEVKPRIIFLASMPE